LVSVVAVLALPVFWISLVLSQLSAPEPEVSSQFKLDFETASRLRPKLIAQSIAPTGRFAMGKQVFDSLVEQVRGTSSIKFAWELRIVNDDGLNAFSSPDGTVYVESGLAQLAGQSTGLWAAILSHEMAHIMRRDWARRYLYQAFLEKGGGAAIVLGDPSLPAATWEDSEKASTDLGRFCRRMELDADREGLQLMAVAGYHPDFVPALHHLLHAQNPKRESVSLYAMHPCWEERDRELHHAYAAASIEFARRWTEWYASPGGNPPIVVFAEEPVVKKTGSTEWQIRIPMRCENLAGAVEVVLRTASGHGANARLLRLSDPTGPYSEIRQLTGCTSPKTTVTFTLAGTEAHQTPGERWSDIYVVDASGWVLARADVPKFPR
jgi:hypothetical protein